MELKGLIDKTIQGAKKYRYALLVLAIGLVLMVLPGKKDGADMVEVTAQSEIQTELDIEQKLASILSRVDGAGEVQVILSVAAGEETVYQTNDDSSNDADSSRVDINTVTVTDSERNECGLVRQVNPAVYQGAVIVCQGADNPAVKLALVDAISKLTGLGANRISVLKMK